MVLLAFLLALPGLPGNPSSNPYLEAWQMACSILKHDSEFRHQELSFDYLCVFGTAGSEGYKQTVIGLGTVSKTSAEHQPRNDHSKTLACLSRIAYHVANILKSKDSFIGKHKQMNKHARDGSCHETKTKCI